MFAKTLIFLQLVCLSALCFAEEPLSKAEKELDTQTEALFYLIPQNQQENRKEVIKKRVQEWLRAYFQMNKSRGDEVFSSSLARVIAERELRGVMAESLQEGPYRSQESETSTSSGRVHSFEVLEALEGLLVHDHGIVRKQRTLFGKPLIAMQEKFRFFSSRNHYRTTRTLLSLAFILGGALAGYQLIPELGDMLFPEGGIFRGSLVGFLVVTDAMVLTEQSAFLFAGNLYGHALFKSFAEKFQKIVEERFGELSPKAAEGLDFRNIEDTFRKGLCAVLFEKPAKKRLNRISKIRVEDSAIENLEEPVEVETGVSSGNRVRTREE